MAKMFDVLGISFIEILFNSFRPFPNLVNTCAANAVFRAFSFHVCIIKLFLQSKNIYIYIQGVTGEKDQTSEECSLGQTIPI